MNFRYRVIWTVLLVAAVVGFNLPTFGADAPDFLVAPYVQLGNRPDFSDAMTLMWHAPDRDAAWAVEVKRPDGWQKMAPPRGSRLHYPDRDAFRIYTAQLRGYPPGSRFAYRVKRDNTVVFQASGQSRKGPGAPTRIAVMGDTGTGTPGQAAVAYRINEFQPDYAVILGDIAYSRGTVKNYYDWFYPPYNANKASMKDGGPLMRALPFVGVAGNHDISISWKSITDLDKIPDALAYFFFWDQPLNGPLGVVGPFTPKLAGSDAAKKRFLAAAGKRFPRMANFSFDYGNVHWLVLDSNPHVDWRDAKLRAWVAADLDAVPKGVWRMVAYHHAAFHSSSHHADALQMRALARLFEQKHVDVVFAGHVHEYERPHPIRYGAEGTITVDRSYDGVKDTTPNGVLYVTSGIGGQRGASEYLGGVAYRPKVYTNVYDTSQASYTAVEVNGARMELRQIGADGKIVDRFALTR
ncbi:MAG: hypothetical protein FJX76_09440 [Armatimonadetes bacterium]|nr:hypothetical protein [Armatimonadota bacterium]